MPDYFSQRINLFVALAPIANVHYLDNAGLQKLAHHWPAIKQILEKLKFYNIFGFNWWQTEASVQLCNVWQAYCDFLISGMDADLTVDNMDLVPWRNANWPAGSSYLDMVYFGQDIVSEDFLLFDYGSAENLQKYGQLTPPPVPLQDFKLPTAMIQGSSDKLSDTLDDEWLYQRISDHVVFRKIYPLGHASFGIAKDMSWFSGDVVDLIKQYNPVQ